MYGVLQLPRKQMHARLNSDSKLATNWKRLNIYSHNHFKFVVWIQVLF